MPGASIFPAPIYYEDMRAYIIRRLLLVVPTLFILSILVFLSVRFIPGDVIDAYWWLDMQIYLAGDIDRAKRWSVGSDWTCRSGCSTDAGLECCRPLTGLPMSPTSRSAPGHPWRIHCMGGLVGRGEDNR